MKIKDAELKSVIAALEAELSQAWESAKPALLAKADEDKEPEKDEGLESASPPPAEDDKSPGVGADGVSTGPGDDAPPAKDGPPAPPPGDQGAPPAGDMPPPGPEAKDPASDEAPLSVEALQAEYGQLSPEELDMHIKAALAAKESLAAAAAGPGGAPPAGPPGGPPAGPPPGLAPAMKSEPSPEIALLRAEIESLKKLQAEKDALVKNQAEDVENLTKAVKMVLERPERKAITGISYLSKSEVTEKTNVSFTPAEARAKLNSIIPNLSKAEKDVVLDFYRGRVGAEKLLPILEKVK